ncbi:MAG: hypothetical protein RL757_2103 [Bacteroidota bacterium]|jgi:hypothetical protein
MCNKPNLIKYNETKIRFIYKNVLIPQIHQMFFRFFSEKIKNITKKPFRTCERALDTGGGIFFALI